MVNKSASKQSSSLLNFQIIFSFLETSLCFFRVDTCELVVVVCSSSMFRLQYFDGHFLLEILHQQILKLDIVLSLLISKFIFPFKNRYI